MKKLNGERPTISCSEPNAERRKMTRNHDVSDARGDAMRGATPVGRPLGIVAAAWRATAATEETMDPLTQLSAETYEDCSERTSKGKPSDKRTAARDGVDRSTASRWRRYGGSPMRDALRWLEGLGPEEAMRAAATFLSVARGVALGNRTVDQLALDYRRARAREVKLEAEDRMLELPGNAWADRARASLRDAGVELHCGSIERLFAIEGVTDSQVFDGGVS